MNLISIFYDLFLDDPEDIDLYLTDVFDLLYLEMICRKESKENSCERKYVSLIAEEFDAEPDLRNLSVYKAAELDPEIFTLLQKAYCIADLQRPTAHDLHRQIYELEDSGVRM